MSDPNSIVRHGIKATFLICLCFFAWNCSRQESSPLPPSGKTTAETQEASSPTASGPAQGQQAPISSSSSSSPSLSTPEESAEPSGNRPPVIEEVTFDPDPPRTGDRIKAAVKVKDPEEDPVDLTYVWKVNGQEVQNSPQEVLDRPVQQGDTVLVEVVASDRMLESKPMTHYAFVVNALPTIRLANQELSNDQYKAHLEVSDPEGGALTLALKSGPPGMTVNSEEATLNWTLPPDAQGNFKVEVSARDERGGEVVLSYDLRVGREPLPAPTNKEGGKDNETSSASSS